MSKVSRRDFLKAAAYGSVGVACMGLAAPALAAGEAAAEQAQEDWLGQPPEIDDSMVKETLDCEILVCGYGTAGNFAAMSAAQSGARVIVIEKAAFCPGIRQQMGAVNTKLQQSAGVVIDRNEITEDICRYSNYWNNPRLVHLWYDKSGPILDFYDDLMREGGLKPHLINYGGNPEARHKAWITGNECGDDRENGITTYSVIEKYVTERGGQILYETPMEKLIKDESGRVVGAYASDINGNYIRINASKGVIVCTGGYACNRSMMRQLQPGACRVYSWERAFGTNVGDGIRACMWAGASKDPRVACMLFDRCALPLGTKGGIAGLDAGCNHNSFGSQPWLSVDLQGERFCNESGPYDYRLHTISSQKDGMYIAIIDSNYREHIEKYDTLGCSRRTPIANWDGVETTMTTDRVDTITNLIEDPTYAVKSDTLEGLAEGLGIPVENFVATVNRYNELCEKGVDEDFGREPYRLVPYNMPPYYGVFFTGTILCTFDGININTKLQALDENMDPIEGLYCAGNDSGNYFCDTYPNLATGCAGGRTATFGWLAAKIALGEEI